MNAAKYLLLILVIGFFTCCQGHDNIIDNNQTPNNPDTTEVEQDSTGGNESAISFSSSPINLDGINAKFAKDIAYGPAKANSFDLFLPQSDHPVPLVIYFHGGGFVGGDKTTVYKKDSKWNFPQEIRSFLRHSIAYATVNYRLLQTVDKQGVIKPLTDSKRALQYIRFVSKDLKVDPDHIALTGNSAGAGISLWLAVSDDMAEPGNSDSLLQQSTRVAGVALRETQSTYDLKRYETDIFADYGLSLQDFYTGDPKLKQRLKSFYGISEISAFNSDSIRVYRKKVDMLTLLSSDDPPFWARNSGSIVKPTNMNVLNHHPYHVRELKKAAEAVGVPNIVYYGDYEDPSGESLTDFLLHLLSK